MGRQPQRSVIKKATFSTTILSTIPFSIPHCIQASSKNDLIWQAPLIRKRLRTIKKESYQTSHKYPIPSQMAATKHLTQQVSSTPYQAKWLPQNILLSINCFLKKKTRKDLLVSPLSRLDLEVNVSQKWKGGTSSKWFC